MKQLIIICLIFQFCSTFSQNCDCENEFDFLVKKIESDYAGFHDKVTEENVSDYNQFTADLRTKAQEIQTFKICTMVLEEWLSYFNDKHLMLGYESSIYYTYKAIDENSSMLRIPSFSWNSKQLIDTLILNNIKEITSKPILIIDLRGNGGGTDYAYQELLPLVYSNPYISKGVEYLASEGNINFFEKALEDGNIKEGREEETRILVDSLKANKGSFYQEYPNDTIVNDIKYTKPKLVGIIIDDFCASSCEQFILSAKQSNKTVVFGTRTLGVLDYSNVVPQDLLTKGLYVRYPMTRSTRLPENPVDNIGIKPDVEINKPVNLDLKDGIDEWVIFVNEYLLRQLEIEK
ncbi:S41 family peptidase [Carboxylicivirga marina]|uniref:S41 family peptidase n=1 Tax=Carboxylicivirga marina TaxID=2800988 RepID=UPI002597D9BD|nr:S41 family peptidase [uncultured Carboxylicivirga sp.]